ncbi:hypothetical protein Pcinc_033203 [Petrolisthes cinctipes]|uniref:Uncharacterized protein n=1 Tax=Petrolisthes cinctipes TaxID=88211 RepID=A0AAE1ESR6_PETCI|nr:hypothetical protein Pcinc_033203 [Petrolisthes cinctipes]
MIQKVQNTVGAELRKNRGASFCKICSVFLTHHKKLQPLLKLLLLEELNNIDFIVPEQNGKLNMQDINFRGPDSGQLDA